MKNALKEKWESGLPTINGWCSIGNSFTAEIMAAQDYDSITIDVQHGALDYGDALPMFQAMRGSGPTLLARVSWREPGIIMKMLDAGAMGIICPMINTAEQAAEFVGYMRYPPLGQRSFGPTRVGFAMPGYGIQVNDAILAFAMIETAEGLENVDEIAATPGIDGLYIGPADLTLGVAQGRLKPAMDREEPEMIEAIQKILSACKKNNIRAALHCGTSEYAARGIDWGFDMVTVAGDAKLLAAAAAQSIKTFRTLTNSKGSEGETGAY